MLRLLLRATVAVCCVVAVLGVNDFSKQADPMTPAAAAAEAAVSPFEQFIAFPQGKSTALVELDAFVADSMTAQAASKLTYNCFTCLKITKRATGVIKAILARFTKKDERKKAIKKLKPKTFCPDILVPLGGGTMPGSSSSGGNAGSGSNGGGGGGGGKGGGGGSNGSETGKKKKSDGKLLSGDRTKQTGKDRKKRSLGESQVCILHENGQCQLQASQPYLGQTRAKARTKPPALKNPYDPAFSFRAVQENGVGVVAGRKYMRVEDTECLKLVEKILPAVPKLIVKGCTFEVPNPIPNEDPLIKSKKPCPAEAACNMIRDDIPLPLCAADAMAPGHKIVPLTLHPGKAKGKETPAAQKKDKLSWLERLIKAALEGKKAVAKLLT